MADLSDIQKKIRDEFADRARNDTKLSEIRKKIQEGADYRIAEQYAERSGQILSEVLRSNITSENFPVGSVEEIAGLIIPPMEQNHHLVGNATSKVQKALNSNGNLGLKPVIPEFDRKAGMHMAGRMAQYESFEEAEWMVGEPIVTDSIGQVDEMLRENADMQFKAGLRPKIIRTAESGCCEWCASLAGEYDYAEVADKGNPVYQRHNNCRCEVTYDPGSGKVQDVWSKAEFDKNSSKEDRASAIRSKEAQLARREQTKVEERIKKAEATAKAMEYLGYSPKGASIWYNANKADIEKYGLEYMLDYTRNANIPSEEDGVDIKLLGSVGAKWKNHDILDPDTGEYYNFIERSTIHNPETFAGFGTHKPLNPGVPEGLTAEYGGDPKKWRHRKGIGHIDVDGEDVLAEVHWFQEETAGKHKFKIKYWL